MKYTLEQRLEIGRRIYEGEINKALAAMMYDIHIYTAREFMRLYKAYLQYQDLKARVEAGEPGAARTLYGADAALFGFEGVEDDATESSAGESPAGSHHIVDEVNLPIFRYNYESIKTATNPDPLRIEDGPDAARRQAVVDAYRSKSKQEIINELIRLQFGDEEREG